MAVSFKDRYRQVFERETNYAVNNIVYIRGTQKGYDTVKHLYTDTLQNTRIKNRIKLNAQEMMARYKKIRNEAYSLTSGAPIEYSEDEIIKMQEEWVSAIADGLSSVSGNLSESTALTMKKIQVALSTMKENGEKQTIEQIHNLVVELEALFNQLSPQEKSDLAGLIYDSHLIEGKIINVENGEIVFSRMRQTLQKMQNLSSSKVSGYIKNVNREFGALGEVMDTFALHQIENIVQDTLNHDIGNLKVQQTGTAQTRDPLTGKLGTGTTDALFTYDATLDGKNLSFDFGISLKTTGTVIDKTGKWIQKTNTPEIKIKSISAQYKLWNEILMSLGSKSKRMENAVLNTLVWEKASSSNYKIIEKGLLASFFEKYLSGGNRLAKTTGIDIADAIMVNGIPIPVTAIIASIVEQLDNDQLLSRNQSLAYINFDVNNKWRGQNNNIMDAIKRSKDAENIIKKSLGAKVFLNGNMLYDIAKSYFRI